MELATSGDAKKAVTFRLGRQELEFGSGHFLSASEVFNVRRSFDAARVYWKQGNYTWNFLVARPVELNPGVFDNSLDHHQSLWTGGMFGPNPLIKKTNVSFYYLGYDRKFARFDIGVQTRENPGSTLAAVNVMGRP